MGQAAEDLEDWEMRQQIGGTWDQAPAKPVFVIDTGPAPEDRTTLEYAVKTYVADWFQDACHDLTPQQLARAYSEQIISEIETPVKLATARDHMTGHWPFLRALAKHDPSAFDHVILSYAQRAG